MKNRIKCFMLGGLLLQITYPIYAESVSTKFSILPAPQQIAKHTYAWIGPFGPPNKKNHGYRMNLAFVIGSKVIAVLDTGYSAAMAREMIKHIRAISSLPIRCAINTNSQPDRYFGNDSFIKQGAKIISTAEEAHRMEKMGGNFSTSVERLLELPKDSVQPPMLPNKIISKPLKIDLGGGTTLTVKPVGTTHTPNALIVIIDNDKIVYAGDTLYAGRLLAILEDSSVKNWITAYDNLRQYKNFTFIPGHGNPGKLKAFEISTYQYLSDMYVFMKKSVDNDVSLDDAITTINQSAYKDLENYTDLAGRNASWAYLEAEKAAFD